MNAATDASGTGSGQTLSSTVLAQVRDAIMRGDLMPGSKLHLGRMRSSFGVSLSPLREALCRLESERLVEIEDHRGYRVTGVSPENLAEVLALRVQLETTALEAAMEHGDTAWEGDVVAALHRLNAAKRHDRTKDEQDAWEKAHRRFHAALVAAPGMPMLGQFCSMLHDQSDRYRRIFLQGHEPDRDVPAEHAAMAGAAIARQGRQAVALLRNHIERTGANVMRVIAAR